MDSTSLNDFAEVICRDGAESLKEAIDAHIFRSQETFMTAIDGLHSPAYRAIFKNDASFPVVKGRWGALFEFPPVWKNP